MTTLERIARLVVLWWGLFAEYRAFCRFQRDGEDAQAPERFVRRLIRLGPAFVKLGQILSTRLDLLPQAYIDALSRLQEDAPPVAASVVIATIERGLRKPVSELFAELEERPAASASLAQVHRARLLDGTPVAVKVQRPDLERLVLRDLDAIATGLRMLARLAPRRMARTNLVAFFEEFRRYTLQELDFANEGHVIDRFRANFVGRTDVHFPVVHWSHTARGILTMDWVEGLRLHEAAQRLSAEQRRSVVSRLMDVLMKMFVSDGLFHADLHPGNIVFHEDGSFTLLDFGMYGELKPAQRDRFILYWFAVAQRQLRRAFHHFRAQTRALEGANEPAFFDRFRELGERFYASTLADTSFTRVYLEMMKAGYAFGYVFPSELMLHAKALTTAEALMFVLAPSTRFEELSRPVIAREYAKRASSLDGLKRRMSQLLPELVLVGESLPAEAIDEDWDRAATDDVLEQLRGALNGIVRNELESAGLWRVLLEPHARAVLDPDALDAPLDAVFGEAWARYYELEREEPVQPSFGAVFTTHLAIATLAMHETLLKHGVPAMKAHSLLHDIGWRFYAGLGHVAGLVASAFTRDPQKRLQLATQAFRVFPFGPPGYAWRDLPEAAGEVAFDCVKCPVASLFSKHDASQLCVATWCKLDFPLAEQWGGHLVRPETLASGDGRCDFRWRVGPAPYGDANEGKR